MLFLNWNPIHVIIGCFGEKKKITDVISAAFALKKRSIGSSPSIWENLTHQTFFVLVKGDWGHRKSKGWKYVKKGVSSREILMDTIPDMCMAHRKFIIHSAFRGLRPFGVICGQKIKTLQAWFLEQRPHTWHVDWWCWWSTLSRWAYKVLKRSKITRGQ